MAEEEREDKPQKRTLQDWLWLGEDKLNNEREAELEAESIEDD